VSSSETVRLLEVDPDLARYMTEADALALEGLPVPAVTVPAGEFELAALLSDQRAFGLILLDGMLVRRVVIGETRTLRLLGVGDVVSSSAAMQSMLVSTTGWSAAAPTRIAVLGREVLFAAHRAPRLVAGLHARSAEQADRVALQLAICQLPRVEDRLLSLLWLLAESWGQVTSQGTALRLHLTHETLGGLVGARRSTVTLALGQLTDEGAILRHERGWLLLAPPRMSEPPDASEPGPELLGPLEPVARVHRPRPSDVAARVKALREATEALRGTGVEARLRLERDLGRLAKTRSRSVELRETARALREPSTTSVLARLHHHDHSRGRIGAVKRQADNGAPEGLAAPVDGVDD
jgi:CRP/FNR family cyclic AMP-dependent transcriptional regulator